MFQRFSEELRKINQEILPAGNREKVIATLQDILYDLANLALQAKVAHWNIVGESFEPLHKQMDEIIEEIRDAMDSVAERITTLDHPADANPKAIAEKSPIPSYQPVFKDWKESVTQLSERITQLLLKLRDGVESTGDLDIISQDLLIGITRDLEKTLWLFESHLK